jgi:3-deoxy-7-phosphoheptulonate synthase
MLKMFPITDAIRNTVALGRKSIVDAMMGRDPRLIVIAGPCSIHDPESALDYAHRMARLREELSDRLIIVMRTYFEKPRTTVGWKGLIYDPGRDQTHDMNHGLKIARQLLIKINALGLPCATEFLDPVVPQYTADLVTWAAIGARTTESQTHRQMASGLSMPVGFKNPTDGSLQRALDAMTAATHPHAFLGIDESGHTSIVRTLGNPHVHLVLRGGGGQPNYKHADLVKATTMLADASMSSSGVMVDCSHENSGKDFARQPVVFRDVMEQLTHDHAGILGLMLESFLVEGRQAMSEELVYGKSITDGCISWDQTEQLLREGYAGLNARVGV